MIWRVTASVHSGSASDWRTVDAKPTFYVHGVDAPSARVVACHVMGASLAQTSGSLLAVNDDLDPILDPNKPGLEPLHYLSWSYEQ